MSRARWLLAGSLGLVAATLIAYAPAFGNGFIWDDTEYVTKSRFLADGAALLRAWTDPESTLQWYPLTRTSFWLEYRLWGLWAGGYHATNVMFHTANAILVWLFLRRLGGRAAWLAAAVFALHPVHVESVGWITERKNVMSGFFYLLSLHAIWGFFEAPGRSKGRALFLLSLLAFAAAMLSKTVTVTLPAVVLVLLWWRRPELGWRGLARATLWLLPFFAVGAVLGLKTVGLEKDVVGASGSEWALTPIDRVLIAGRALWFYLDKLVWPQPLAFFYERWRVDRSSPGQYLYPAAFIGLLASTWLARGRIGRAPVAVALIFAGTLFPALGFFNVYPMRFSFVADHFQYLASVAPIAFVCALLARAADRFAPQLSVDRGALPPPTVSVRVVAPAFLLISLATVASIRNHAFESLETLWRDTVVKTPSSSAAHQNLGILLEARGSRGEALEHFWTAARLSPGNAIVEAHIGTILDLDGKPEEGAAHLAEALRLAPNDPDVHLGLAAWHARARRWSDALAEYKAASRLAPTRAAPYVGAGMVMEESGNPTRAAGAFGQALKLDPTDAAARAGLARARAGMPLDSRR